MLPGVFGAQLREQGTEGSTYFFFAVAGMDERR